MVKGWREFRSGLLVIGLALLLNACANQQLQTKTQQYIPTARVLTIDLQPADLRKGGIAFTTPASITGQEEDKQALALAFAQALLKMRPDLSVIALPQTLSAVNREGLTREYQQMFEDYRLTGIFDRETLQKAVGITKARYLAQLKLGAFRQESMAEEYVSMKGIVQESARDLVAHLT